MQASYDYYHIFYYVAKYGSITRAAKVLMNSQPNISRSIRNLEAALGCRLFERTHTGVALTAAGELLFEHVQSAEEQLRLGEARVRSINDPSRGQVSLAATDIALHGVLLPILQQFRHLYPHVQLDFSRRTTLQAIQSVQDGLTDLAVVSTPVDTNRPLTRVLLMPFQDTLVAGAEYRHLAGRKLHLTDLQNYPLILLSQETTTFHFYDRLFSAAHAAMRPAIEATSVDQLLLLIRHDLGLGFIPSFLIQNDLKSGDLLALSLAETIPERHICLIRDKSRPLGAAASALENMILQTQADSGAGTVS